MKLNKIQEANVAATDTMFLRMFEDCENESQVEELYAKIKGSLNFRYMKNLTKRQRGENKI